MKSIKTYLLLLALSCVGCSKTDIWLGESKKEKLPGERVIIIPETRILEVDREYKGYHVNIPTEQSIEVVDRSTGVDSTRYPNLKLGKDLSKAYSYSFTSSK